MVGKLTVAPPFLVQAYRKGHWMPWATDSRHETLPAALAAGETLHRTFDRIVRVVDQHERILGRWPMPAQPGRRRAKRMTVLCCGDRHWADEAVIVAALKDLAPPVTLVHGGCRGADTMCGAVGVSLGYAVQSVPADWARYGLRAGPVRNQLMLDTYPDIALVLAFHRDYDRSKGTRDMVRRATAKGIPVRHFPPRP